MAGAGHSESDEGGAKAVPPPSAFLAKLRTSLVVALDRLQSDRACWFVLGGAMAAYAALAMWIGRGTTLFVDEANLFVTDRGFTPEALLTPLNGHLILLERIVYAAGFKLFGPNFVVFRLVEVAGAVLAVGLLFTLVKRRVGPSAALAAALLLLFFGSAWEVTFDVSGITNVYCMAAGLGALLALESRSTRGDLLACALLVVAIASWSLGVVFAIGVGILILRGPDRWRRVWICLIPLALYGAWLGWIRAAYVPEHGEVQTLHLSNVLLVPNFIADEAAAVAGAVAGLNYDFSPSELGGDAFKTSSPYGPLIAALAVVALALRLRRGAVSPLLWALISILLAFWIALGLSFGVGRSPTTARYVYPGAFLALLITAEAARGMRLSRTALLAIFAVAAIALWGNLARLRDGANFYRAFSLSLRGELTAIEVARGHVSSSFVPPGPGTFDSLQAGPYLAAVDRIGSPAFTPTELTRQSEGVRHSADSALVPALGIGVETPPRGTRRVACRRLGASGGDLVRLAVDPPGVLLRSPVSASVVIRRFATTSSVSAGTLPADKLRVLSIPADRYRSPWYVAITPAPRPVTVCQPAELR
jgi:hypothetical protein